MSISIFGTQLTAPVMGAPMSSVKTNMNDAMPEEELFGSVKGSSGIWDHGHGGKHCYKSRRLGGRHGGEELWVGIPSFKPQAQDRLIKLFQMAEKLDVIAIEVDLEGAGHVLDHSGKNGLPEGETSCKNRRLHPKTRYLQRGHYEH